jgi:hypothetical protein
MEQATTIFWTSRSMCSRCMSGYCRVCAPQTHTRVKLLGFPRRANPVFVAMEACAVAHYWAREIAKLGHRVSLIAPAYVQPFIKAAEGRCRCLERPSVKRRSGRACLSKRHIPCQGLVPTAQWCGMAMNDVPAASATARRHSGISSPLSAASACC